MNVSIGLLCFDIFRTKRDQMFLATLKSLRNGGYPSTLHVVTNGSTDGTERVVRDLGGIVDDRHTAPWYGMQVAFDAGVADGADLVVFSADDIAYTPGWLARLVRFWAEAPDDVKLATQFLEPEYPWNAIGGADTIGGERCLFRESVPGSSWSLRARDWPVVGPMPTYSPREDLDTCAKLRAAGYRLAALDLAEHVGERQSSWGNQSHLYARPLDRARWGFGPAPDVSATGLQSARR